MHDASAAAAFDAADTVEKKLPLVLATIHRADVAHEYQLRENAIYCALQIASVLGYRRGIRFDSVDGKMWPVAVIVLPEGQVAWHLQAIDCEYDGHTTEEKYERIRRCEERIRAKTAPPPPAADVVNSSEQ